MYKNILVPATGSATDLPVFTAAALAARGFGAHLLFLHVGVDVRQAVVAMTSAEFIGGSGLDDIIRTMEDDAAAAQWTARQAAAAFCAGENISLSDSPASGGAAGAAPTAEWVTGTGDEPETVATHGRAADLVVLGRSREDEGTTMAAMEAALMHSGRPLLIAPLAAPAHIGRNIMIAWKDTAEAARAVAAALPFLAAAEQVTIVSVSEESGTDADSRDRLYRALCRHNPATTARHVQPEKQSPVEALLSAAAAAQADLLVMGGYGHSRVREMVFGGFTRHVLEGADLSVLIAH